MPRLPRLHVPGGCYHLVLRGNHREDLFSHAEDRHALNVIVAESLAHLGRFAFDFLVFQFSLHASDCCITISLGRERQKGL